MLYLKFCNRPSVRPPRHVPAMFLQSTLHVPYTFLKPVTVFDLPINTCVNDELPTLERGYVCRL